MVFFSPTMVMILLKSNVLHKYTFKELEICITGGSKLHKETLEELQKCLPHVELWLGYGM